MKRKELANELRFNQITIPTKRARFSDNFIVNAEKSEKRARKVLKKNLVIIKKSFFELSSTSI